MTNPVNDFEARVRDALNDVSRATTPPPGLAERLMAAAEHEPVATVTSLSAHRTRRIMMPLLAAAAVAVAALVGVFATNVFGNNAAPPATQTQVPPVSPTSVVPPPTPTPTTPTHTHAPTSTPPVAGFSAVDHASLADNQHRWVLGEAPCSAGSSTRCPALYATSDGGVNWAPVPLPDGLVETRDTATGVSSDGSCANDGTIVGPCANSIEFADTQHGYLWGPHEFYWTNDGGQNWQREMQNGSLQLGAIHVVFAGGNALRIVANEAGSNPVPGTLQAAPLGSGSWTTVSPRRLGIGSQLEAVGNDVYLLAIDSPTVARPTSGMYRSTDGGRTWNLLGSNPCGSDFSSPGSSTALAQGFTVDGSGTVTVTCLDNSTVTIR